ncbi:MAG: flavodoxin family protein [Marinilabiliales bacterium]
MLTTINEIFVSEGIDSKIIQIGGKALNGCMACYKCYDNKDKKCSVDDDFNNYFADMIDSDVIIIGSPTYVADITPQAKALIDRACIVNRANNGILKRKIGAAVIPVRRAGSVHAFDSINHFFLISEMIIPGSIYWNMSIARNIGEYQNDEEGVRTMKKLAENIVWVLKKIKL